MKQLDIFSDNPARQITVGELKDCSDKIRNKRQKLPIKIRLQESDYMQDFFLTKKVYSENVSNNQSEVWMQIDGVKYPVTVGFVLGLMSFADNS